MSTRKTIPKKTRQEVYEKCNGHCAYCGCELEYKDMQVDHMECVYTNEKYQPDKNIDTMENYMPSCRQCNFYKSTSTLEVFRERLTTVMMDNLRKNFNYRLAIKYGIVTENVEPIQFYFEKMESEE